MCNFKQTLIRPNVVVKELSLKTCTTGRSSSPCRHRPFLAPFLYAPSTRPRTGKTAVSIAPGYTTIQFHLLCLHFAPD
jgi:hypothetical protein